MRTALLRTLLVTAVAAAAVLLPAMSAQASAPSKEHDTVQSSAPAGDVGIQVTKLTHAQATSMLRASNITWSSSGNCSDRYNSTCTSFEQVNLATIQGAQTLKSACGCALNITGGTEVGHASGTYSHWNGYKLDYSPYSGVTNYIHNNFTYIGNSQWRSGSGNIYYFEVNHWDVTYYNCGGC
jgi:hypothetical protein